jgi:hypothetical protein
MKTTSDAQKTIEQELNIFEQDVLAEFKDNYGKEIEQFVQNMVATHSEWTKLDE